MESAITIFNQILKMFLMMSVGFLLYRKKNNQRRYNRTALKYFTDGGYSLHNYHFV